MKRAISMILCLVLIGSLLPASALALDLGGAAAVGSEAAVEESVVVETAAEAPVEEAVEEAAAADGAASVKINSTNFPDAVFRKYVSQKADLDGDGTLSSEECAAVESIVVPDMGIGSLKGLEFFLNLSELDCSSNNLMSLNISKNAALIYLTCSFNNIGALDLSNNAELMWVICNDNELTDLDVSSCPKVTTIWCGKNQLTSLNTKGCSVLMVLYARENQLTALDLREHPLLMELACGSNDLTKLYLGQKDRLEFLECDANDLQSLDISGCPNLMVLYAGGNELTELDVSGNRQIVELVCSGNSIQSLDVSMLEALQNLDCTRCQLSELDVTKNIELKTLSCTGNNLDELDVTSNALLEHLSCQSNSISKLNLRNNTALLSLHCDLNKLTELDLSGLANLTTLACRGNKLTELNVQGCTGLEDMDCSENMLATLDVSDCTALSAFGCEDQKAYSSAGYESGQYLLDMSELVGVNNIGKVTGVENSTYNAETGIAVLNEKLDSVRYFYDEGSDLMRMWVDVYLEYPMEASEIRISCSASTGKPRLDWDAVDGAAKYEIWRSASKNGTYSKIYTTANTFFNNTSAVAGKTYYYKVRAVYADGAVSDFSRVKNMTCDYARPNVSISCNESTGKPRLSWSAVSGATKYEIWRATSKTGTYTKIYTTSNTYFNNSSAAAGKTYYYKVRALGASSYATSAYSTVDYITCDCAKPVVSISCKASTGKPVLSWEAVDGAVKYEVWRAYSKNGTYYKMGTTTGTSYTNTGAKANTTYYYKVYAIGNSSYSKSAASAVVNMTCDCARPVVTATTNSSGKPRLSWSAVDGAVKYEIWRSGYRNGTYTKIYTTTNTYFNNTSAGSGYTYFYKVRAVGSSSYATSAYSSIVSAKCK